MAGAGLHRTCTRLPIRITPASNRAGCARPHRPGAADRARRDRRAARDAISRSSSIRASPAATSRWRTSKTCCPRPGTTHRGGGQRHAGRAGLSADRYGAAGRPAAGLVTCLYKGALGRRAVVAAWRRCTSITAFCRARSPARRSMSAAAVSARRSRCGAMCSNGSAVLPGCATNSPTITASGAAVRGSGSPAVLSRVYRRQRRRRAELRQPVAS